MDTNALKAMNYGIYLTKTADQGYLHVQHNPQNQRKKDTHAA